MKPAAVILVTDPRYSLARTTFVIRAAARALNPGGLVVQLRDKESPDAAALQTARSLREVTRSEGALLIINGALALAIDTGADGLHFPSEGDAATLAARIGEARRALGPDAFLTAATHDDDAVARAAAAGASAVLVSPIFATPGKGAPRGTSAIASARAIVDAAAGGHRPRVYALGGVDAAGASRCALAGASGVAVIRALLDAAEPGQAARELAGPYIACRI